VSASLPLHRRRVSTHFGLDSSEPFLGFVDVDVDGDVPVFLDSGAILALTDADLGILVEAATTAGGGEHKFDLLVQSVQALAPSGRRAGLVGTGRPRPIGRHFTGESAAEPRARSRGGKAYGVASIRPYGV